MIITSTSNEQVKKIKHLQTSSRFRREEGLFVAEGMRLVKEVPGERLYKLYVSESFSQSETFMTEFGSEKPIVLSDRVFEKASDTKTPQGVLALVKMETVTAESLFQGEMVRLLILEDLQDPGNFGTLLRTAEGAGFTGVVLSRKSVDCSNPKAVRGSMGAIFRMPIAYVDDISSTIQKGKEHKITFFAAHLEGSREYDKVVYPAKTALLIGNEGNGLSENVTNFSDQKIRIPMEGAVESLNAAVAASLLMYEVYRQSR